jgi:ABC-2 type transport system permease protein
MNTIFSLLRPRILSGINSLRQGNKKNNWARIFMYSALGIIFWIGTFIIFYRVLSYFQSVQDFGNILAIKLLSMIIMTFFTLLLFSNIINCLSHLYLSYDLPLLHSLPVSSKDIFLSKWLISAFDSSWMIVAFSLPIFLSYGLIYKANIIYYVTFLTAMIFMCLIASALGGILVLFGAIILPAGRIRTILILLGVIMVMILVFILRLTRPEQLVNPDSFASVVLYLNSMQTPNSPLLPTTWITDTIKAALDNETKTCLFNLTLTGTFAFMLIFINNITAKIAYFTGFSKSQTTPGRLFAPLKYKGFNWESSLNFLPRESKAFAVKEIRTFFRDSSQWPQLFLMAALVTIYLYNFSVLPLNNLPIKTVYLQNLFSFLNIGLAASVLSAISARFVFPAVSMEGEAFWIVQAAPVSTKKFLWIKFFLYYIPLIILAEILVIFSNLFLQVSPFMMVLSTITIFCLVPAVVGLATGLGAIYADFKSENPVQVVTGFGGLLFMILSFSLIAVVIFLEAGPVYYIFMAQLRGQSLSLMQMAWITCSFGLALFLSLLAIFYTIHLGEKSLLIK